MKHIVSVAAGTFTVIAAVAALVIGAAYAGGSLPSLNGDVDCSGSVGPVDSLKILRFDAGLSNSQAPGCAPIGDPGSGNPPTSTPQPTPEPTPAGPATTFGSGAHIVGTDIAAGTYRNSDSSGGCFWERLSGFGGTFDDIIANGFADYLQIVTIKATDAGFSSERCGTWSPAAGAITSSPTAPFSDGMYFVGTDIAPGTWRNEASSSCFWQRLSGFTGNFDQIIANGFSDAQQIVTISASDVGFQSSNCGAWTKIG